MKYAIVNSSGIIENVIVYDGESAFATPSGCAIQSVNDWLNIGDNVTAVEPAPTMTPQQRGAAAIATGIVITSTGTPELNGTYPVDPVTQVKLNSAITYLMLNNAFPPASAGSMPWYDSEGNVHTFTDPATFKAFATAFADFVAHVDIYVSSDGESGSIPSNSITIA